MNEISDVKKKPTRMAASKKYPIDDFRKKKNDLVTGTASGCS